MDLVNTLSSCLCPAGNGVHTVETAKEKKQSLQQLLYGESNNNQEIIDIWQKQLHNNINSNKPLILGICSDTGGGILRGANWGPLCLRQELYKDNFNQNIIDIGDIRIIPHLLHDKYLNQETINHCRKALYQSESPDTKNLPVSPLSITEFILDKIYSKYPNKKIFSIGGDHSISYATVGAYLRNKKKNNTRTAIIHFDAHTDLSDQRLGIDLNFSTWAYAILPLLNTPKDLIQIGLRSSKHNKNYWESKLGVQQFWSHEVKELGINSIIDNVVQYLNTQNIEEIFVSFDVDAIDSDFISATGTPEKDGLTPDDALAIIKAISNATNITGADIVEIAPFVKTQNINQDKTLEISAEISRELIKTMI